MPDFTGNYQTKMTLSAHIYFIQKMHQLQVIVTDTYLWSYAQAWGWQLQTLSSTTWQKSRQLATILAPNQAATYHVVRMARSTFYLSRRNGYTVLRYIYISIYI